jgi:hypothetical protein
MADIEENDAAPDALRFLVATQSRTITQPQLRGFCSAY